MLMIRASLLATLALLLAACTEEPREFGGQDQAGGGRKDGAVQPKKDAGPGPKKDGGKPKPPDAGVDGAPADQGTKPDQGTTPPKKPKQLDPCKVGKCWSAGSLSGLCGVSSLNEDYSSGKYNAHRRTLAPKTGVKVELTLAATAGSWKPALIINDAAGATVFDGQTAWSDSKLSVQTLSTGKTGSAAKVRLTAHKASTLTVYATGWTAINSGFSAFLPKSAKYTLTVNSGCPPPKPGKLLSPPNFDKNNKDSKGYYLLPQSQPSGLYTRKADACSRGTKLLIDVLYTVAYHWKSKQPKYSPIKYLDLNEAKSCSTVNHATHDDGTHADLTAGCATQVSCTNNQPAIDLAKLFVDTGQVCGIINNDTAVQKVVNAYFKSKFSYKPWHGTFMRSVSGHTHHFHVRVKKPNGSCN